MRIDVFGSEWRVADLSGIEVQFEPLMSWFRIPNLEAPLVIIAIINNFSEQLLVKTSAIRIDKSRILTSGPFHVKHLPDYWKWHLAID